METVLDLIYEVKKDKVIISEEVNDYFISFHLLIFARYDAQMYDRLFGQKAKNAYDFRSSNVGYFWDVTSSLKAFSEKIVKKM